MKLTDFEVYRNLLQQKSGLALTADKSYLLESRLAPVIKKWDIDGMAALTQILRGQADPQLVDDIAEGMTVSETRFFRDYKPFDKLRDLLPGIIKAKGAGTVRIWSAGCSSGQEAYSLAVLTKENAAGWPGASFEIIATDLSKPVLTQARAGAYSQFEVQYGMPSALLIKYFTQAGATWTLKDDIKRMVKFETFNLLDSMDALGTFDVIFCRNVFVGFNQQTKTKVLDQMAARLAKHGYLFLGSNETILGATDKFKALEGERGIYRPT